MTLQEFKKLNTKHKVRRKNFKTKYKIYSVYIDPSCIEDKTVFGVSSISSQICINYKNYKKFILCLK